MNKNIKLLIPFAVIAGLGLTSCNKNSSGLKREEYGNTVGTLTELKPIIDGIGAAQKTDGKYNIPKKGTVEVKIDFSITGNVHIASLDFLYPDSSAIYDFNNISLGLNDVITIKWNLDENYLGVVNKHGDSTFITKVGDTWGTYFVDPILGKKYYRPLSSDKGNWLDSQYFGSIENYFMYAISANTGVFHRSPTARQSSWEIQGGGLGISGFGGNLAELIEDSNPHPYPTQLTVVNYLAPGIILNKDLDVRFGEEKKLTPIYEIIDSFLGNEKFTSAFAIKSKYTHNNEKTGATANLKVDKLDFSKNTDLIIEEIGELAGIEKITDVAKAKGEGTLTLDYFINFKDNFVHQHELLADADKINFQLVLNGLIGDLAYIHISDLNAKGYISETFDQGKFDGYQKPDTTGYEALDMIPLPNPRRP